MSHDDLIARLHAECRSDPVTPREKALFFFTGFVVAFFIVTLVLNF